MPGMSLAGDFTFDVLIDRQAYKPKMQSRLKGAWPASSDLLL